eukprot:jgi/Tetstr1/424018/TSEL_014629.t1
MAADRAREVPAPSRQAPPSNVAFKGEEEVCEVTPYSGAAALVGYAVNKVVPLPFAGTAASPELHGYVGVSDEAPSKEGGRHNQAPTRINTNAVKNLVATQAFPGDNVDKGSGPEPPAKKATQPAKPAAGVPAWGGGGGGARAGGGPFGMPLWQQEPLPPPASSRPAAVARPRVAVPAQTGCK